MELINSVFLGIGIVVGVFSLIMFYGTLGYIIIRKSIDAGKLCGVWFKENIKVGSMINAMSK